MKKILTFILLTIIAGLSARADEGMWLPSLISQRISDMQQKGFRLDAEDIYSINEASLKPASLQHPLLNAYAGCGYR